MAQLVISVVLIGFGLAHGLRLKSVFVQQDPIMKQDLLKQKASFQEAFAKQDDPPQKHNEHAVMQFAGFDENDFFGVFALRHQLKKFGSNTQQMVMVGDSQGKKKQQEYMKIFSAVGVPIVEAIDPKGSAIVMEAVKDCRNRNDVLVSGGYGPCRLGHFLKLLMYNQTRHGFSKIAFLDLDVHAWKPFDDIFGEDHVSIAKWVQTINGQVEESRNSGVVVFKPSNDLFEKMVARLPELAVRDSDLQRAFFAVRERPGVGDQAFQKAFFDLGYGGEHKLHELPTKYNTRSMGAENQSLKESKLVHFIEKPWQHGDRFLQRNSSSAETSEQHLFKKIACDFTVAAHSTLESSKASFLQTSFEHRFQNWRTLVGDESFVKWASQNCKDLPISSEDASKSVSA